MVSWALVDTSIDQNIALPAKVMKQLGREDEGIKLPDGTYYGSLMVFHHLHCLVRLFVDM